MKIRIACLALATGLIPVYGGHSPVASREVRQTIPATQQSGITEKNWQSHPKINEIRRLVTAIYSRLKRGALKISQREFEWLPFRPKARSDLST
jgi:hypothetical protein